MNYTPLVPKEKALNERRAPMGSDFWNDFWKEFDDEKSYNRKINKFKKSVSDVLEVEVSDNNYVYAEVILDEKASSKTNKPSKIWEQTSLDIVCASENKLTVTGKKEDFRKFKSYLDKSSFVVAKNGAENVTRKEKNIFRELYAMTAIRNKNIGFENRLSRELNNLILLNNEEEIDCLIEIYQNQPRSGYNSIYNEIVSFLGNAKLTKRDTEFFIHNMSFEAKLTINSIKALLENAAFAYIYKIKVLPKLVSQRCIPREDFGDIEIEEYETNEVVGIIDSGVNHPILNPHQFNRESFIGSNASNFNHGSFVASRIIYGDKIFSDLKTRKSLRPIGKFLDVQVLKSDLQVYSIDKLKKAIDTVINRYTDISVYNFSIAMDKPIEDDDIDDLTEFLDVKAKEKDVIFVCSVGNQKIYTMERNYSDIFNSSSIGIACPSDALNVISVGSISEIVGNDCVCEINGYPSPFTRKGGNRGGLKKPELVCCGGNVQKNLDGIYDDEFLLSSNNKYGVEGIDSRGLNKDFGTSFSTPLVTRQCLYIADYIKKNNLNSILDLDNNRINFIKALLIHSCAKKQQEEIEEEEIKKAVGFGVPEFSNVLRDDDDSVTIIYSDSVRFKQKKHKLRFIMPDFLLNNPAEFICTLVYNPPVNKNYPENYNMISVAPSLRMVEKDLRGEFISKGSIAPTEWDWDSYKKRNFNVVHFKKRKRKINSRILEVLVQMDVFSEYEREVGNVDLIEQPYSIILTIKDLSKLKRLRTEILEMNELQEIVENDVTIEIEG